VNVENDVIRNFVLCNPQCSGAELEDDPLGETSGTCGVRRLIHTELWENLKETKLKLNSVALVRERTVPTERPPPVGEVSANFCG